MISIVKATPKDNQLLSAIATQSFMESHGNSAPAEDINNYVAKKYNAEVMKEELNDAGNIYHIIYHDSEAAGFSKIILNSPYEKNTIQHVTKLERLYLLEQFYNLRLGAALFDFNLNFIKNNHQLGVWLYVWKQNERAVNFYKKKGFVIIGSYDFAISETHANPNHQMLLRF
jgi:ribosomal protein S18 acetylase RimI-like enzyme